ncbi:hypothetical protein DSUL_20093 [Desulfovibrionales bacterium]
MISLLRIATFQTVLLEISQQLEPWPTTLFFWMELHSPQAGWS